MITLLSVGPILALAAQAPVVLTLPPAELRYAESFSMIAAIRGLPDGRVIVLDSKEQRLLVLGTSGQTIGELSREGRGPGEYTFLAGMHALAADSTLIEDRRALRWLVPNGTKTVSTVTTWTGAWSGPMLVGADSLGRVLELRGFSFRRTPGVPFQPLPANAESVLVILHQRTPQGAPRAVSRSDTLARLRGPTLGERWVTHGTVQGAPLRFHLHNPLAAPEQALMFRDGWIAFALLDPYRVEWRRPDGRRIHGEPLPIEPIAVDERQKRAAIARRWPAVNPPFQSKDFPPWPQLLPPFGRSVACRASRPPAHQTNA